MTPKIAGFTGFVAFTVLILSTIAVFLSLASPTEYDSYFRNIPFGAMGVAMVYPYTVVASFVLMVYRNRWLEGSLMRWAKHSALSFVLTALGLGIGTALCFVMLDLAFEFEKGTIWFNLTVVISVTMFASTPLLFFAGQIAMLRARATRSGQAL